MMLAVTFSFVMLGFGGAGGIINMSYQLNEIDPQHAVGDRALPPHLRRRHRHHVLHGGVRAVAAAHAAARRCPHGLVKTQLWLWFVGMMVLTMPWHLVGLLGMPRRMAYYDYTNPDVAAAGVDGDGVDDRRLRAAWSRRILFVYILAARAERARRRRAVHFQHARRIPASARRWR